jgi:sensor histidine kinase regulating citrate/malate metabolism
MLAIVVVIVVVGGALAALDARRDGDDAARERVVAIASSLAAAPSTAAAIQSGDPTAALQPVTEKVRHDTQIAFITIMSPEGTRFTHTDPSLIGQTYLGTTEPALRGETFTEVFTGTLGPSIRAVAPVYASDGRIVGLVSAGITQQTLAENWYAQLPWILLVAATAVLAAIVGMWLVRRRLLRQTGGLSPRDLRVMYEHHDAVLHSITEGLVVVENDRAVLINDEARRLLDVDDEVPIDMGALPRFLGTGSAVEEPAVKDEVRVTKDRVLVVNRAPVSMGPRTSADVVTIRDRTELQGALGELDSMKVFAESLRSQAHEAANRLHTIVALVEMGRGDEAVRFATTELELSQRLVDRLTAAVHEPALVALLLGKSAQAAERGITLTVTDDTHLGPDELGGVLTPNEMVTVLGNLVDNALDACDKDDPWVEVTVRQEDAALRIVVADSGPGMDAATFDRARRRGYSTKEGGAEGRRGLGLALVSQVVDRHGGQLTAEVTYGSVVAVTIPRGVPPRGSS